MSLAGDILPTIDTIAEYIYGQATPGTMRRVRHLIAKGELPTKKIGGRRESRKSWIDATYAKPDHPKPNGMARNGSAHQKGGRGSD
jgi:hypothetical protein